MPRPHTLVLTLLAASIACLPGCKRNAPRDDARAERTIPYTPTGRNVWLIGWDGMSASVLSPLLDQGKLPNLARMMRGGASGHLRTTVPTHSPIIWTSIATGKGADKHGIKGFWHPAPASDISLSPEEQAQIERLKALGYVSGAAQTGDTVNVLYSSTDRRVKTLWNVLTEQDLNCSVIGWWVSWPAENISGVMVSDRFAFNRFQVASKERGFVASRTADLVSPAAMAEELAPLVIDPQTVTPEDLQQFIGGDVELRDDFKLHDIIDELRIVYAQDESHILIAKRLLSRSKPDLFALYIQGTDIVCHYFFKYRFPADWAERYEPVDPAEIRRYGSVIDHYFQLQDQRLGELMALADDNTIVMLVSDHGFAMGKRVIGDRVFDTISGIHGPRLNPPPPGVIVMYGAGIKPDVRLKNAHVFDVTPTILTLLGLPVADDMDGKVLTDALEGPATGGPIEITRINTYESESDAD